MLKLKLQYFGHLIWRTDSLEKSLMLGKIESGRRKGWQRMRWLDGITDSMDEFEQALGAGDGQGSVTCCSPWGLKESDTTEWLNWSRTMMWIQLRYKEFPSPQRSFILLFYCHTYFILSSMPPTDCDFSNHSSLIALYNVNISRMLQKWKCTVYNI